MLPRQKPAPKKRATETILEALVYAKTSRLAGPARGRKSGKLDGILVAHGATITALLSHKAIAQNPESGLYSITPYGKQVEVTGNW